MKILNKQKGFTLIELVVVIVILGILAATAAPKFIDLQGDARAATMSGVKAAVETATALTHSKALIQNRLTGAQTIVVNGGGALGADNVGVVFGWPDNGTDGLDTWDELLDLDVADFLSATDGATGTATGRVVWYPAPVLADVATVIATNCYVEYVESIDSNEKPDITAVITGC